MKIFLLINLIIYSLLIFIGLWEIALLAYLSSGSMIYLVIINSNASFPKVLFLWLPAMITDNPQWLD